MTFKEFTDLVKLDSLGFEPMDQYSGWWWKVYKFNIYCIPVFDIIFTDGLDYQSESETYSNLDGREISYITLPYKFEITYSHARNDYYITTGMANKWIKYDPTLPEFMTHWNRLFYDELPKMKEKLIKKRLKRKIKNIYKENDNESN